jgi:hypothetical protein
VNGLLAVSRALGDTFLDKFVSHEPDLHEVNLHETEQSVLILACDGLWDVVKDEDATELIADIDNPEQAALTLRNTALSKGSTDNISVVVIFIPSLTVLRNSSKTLAGEDEQKQTQQQKQQQNEQRSGAESTPTLAATEEKYAYIEEVEVTAKGTVNSRSLSVQCHCCHLTEGDAEVVW